MLVRNLGRTDYTATWLAMREFTAQRTTATLDELWLTEHAPVYTVGLNRKDLCLPLRQDIPLVHTDRGGKITYHGPGQVVIYLLLDLARRRLAVRGLVVAMESAVISLLAEYGVIATSRQEAPGVYVDGRKIASIGLRLKYGCCYHGLSINVDMDLTPFSAIDPCGYRGLEVTQTHDLGIDADAATLSARLTSLLDEQLARISASHQAKSL